MVGRFHARSGLRLPNTRDIMTALKVQNLSGNFVIASPPHLPDIMTKAKPGYIWQVRSLRRQIHLPGNDERLLQYDLAEGITWMNGLEITDGQGNSI